MINTVAETADEDDTLGNNLVLLGAPAGRLQSVKFATGILLGWVMAGPYSCMQEY